MSFEEKKNVRKIWLLHLNEKAIEANRIKRNLVLDFDSMLLAKWLCLTSLVSRLASQSIGLRAYFGCHQSASYVLKWTFVLLIYAGVHSITRLSTYLLGTTPHK